MIGKIEKGVSLPMKAGTTTSIFYEGLLELFDKLEISDSVLFKLPDKRGYNFMTKITGFLRIYRIIKKQMFVSESDNEARTFRVWRIR